MNIKHLIPMANRIAQFFATQPPLEQQAGAVAKHLRMFWAPAMRQSLLEFVQGLPENMTVAAEGSGLHPLVIQAVRQNYQELKPSAAADE